MSYLYIKKTGKKYPSPKTTRKLFALPLFLVGLGLILWAVLPILRFQFFGQEFQAVVSPLVKSNRPQDQTSILGDTTDYTNINNWFQASPANANLGALDLPLGAVYDLSIPKLKIDSAKITIGGEDLKHSLIHYAQTALPGQLGSPVIFGHSVLPQFFNSKNYMTIFSTLFKLKQDDDIFLNYDQVRYRYQVFDIYETQASDLSVLEQHFDGKYLTLVTCHPPGTYLRRLVIKARLVDY